jgi:predicted Zn-dependent protease
MYLFLVLGVLVISLVFLGIIFLRRLPELRVLDLKDIPKEKKDATKIKILEAKFLRQHQKTQERLDKVVSPLKAKTSLFAKNVSDKVKLIEKKYKRQEQIEEIKVKSINELFGEAEALLDSGNYNEAEKNLIEVLARDKKNFQAYEMLSELYRRSKSYDQAEEVIKYLIKLKSLKFRQDKTPEYLKREKLEDTENEILEAIDIDSSLSRYYDDLAEVYGSMGKSDKALDAYLKANAIEPNNPKFLDKVIELAIVIGDKGLTKKTYRRLKEINPENAKLGGFKEALEKMK